MSEENAFDSDQRDEFARVRNHLAHSPYLELKERRYSPGSMGAAQGHVLQLPELDKSRIDPVGRRK